MWCDLLILKFSISQGCSSIFQRVVLLEEMWTFFRGRRPSSRAKGPSPKGGSGGATPRKFLKNQMLCGAFWWILGSKNSDWNWMDYPNFTSYVWEIYIWHMIVPKISKFILLRNVGLLTPRKFWICRFHLVASGAFWEALELKRLQLKTILFRLLLNI